MTVLVSGGTGHVGRYIVERLLKSGYAVTIGGRTPPAPTLFSQPVAFVPLSLEPALDQIDAFDNAYHFVHAAFDHVPGRYRGGEGDDPDGFRSRNLDGSIKLFETARRAGTRRCIFLSSRAVYGPQPAGTMLDEEMQATPETLYGEVKRDAEQALAALSAPGFTTASLRLTGVYGDLRPNKWDTLLSDYLSGIAAPIRAGTEVHGRDAADAVRLMLALEPGKVDGHTFNVSDIVTDTREILAAVQQATGCRHPLPPIADRFSINEMSTARIRALGWTAGGRAQLVETVGALALRHHPST